MSKRAELSGKRFGRLTVIKRVRLGDSKGRWLCRCDCGNEKIILTDSLTRGAAKSCGCYRREVTSRTFKKHGSSNDRLYAIWLGIKDRCNNPNNLSYKNYGARGISVCKEWEFFSAFGEWAISNGYSDNLTIERVDCFGNYEPSNCTWIEKKFQSRNTRMTTQYTINGMKKPLIEWCEMFSVPLNRAHHRIYSGKEPFNVCEVFKALHGGENE